MNAQVEFVQRETRWQPRPWFARALRVALVVAPFICGWMAIRLSQRFFFGADITGISGAGVFLAQAIVVSVAVAAAVSRLLHRWTPLVALFEMSLVFPDHAPSRFKLALRSSSVKKLLQGGQTDLSSDVQTAAEQAVQLVSELAKHDRLTRGHTERVRAYADVIGQEFGLSDTDLNGLRWGALLHDVGKMAVPPEILNKPGKPNEEEWAILRQHPTAAIAMLEPLQDWLGDWLLAASEHHERWDGTGYPVGLSGNEISLAGRIVAVADAYDVITSRRSYKAPATAEQARKELVKSAGSHFDPVVVRAMLEAGLRNTGAATRFGWILEAPGIARFLQVGGQAVSSVATSTATAAAAVAVATATAVVGGVEAPNPPPQIAFAQDDAGELPVAVPDLEATSPTTIVVTATLPGEAPATTTVASTAVATAETDSSPTTTLADTSAPELPGGVSAGTSTTTTSTVESPIFPTATAPSLTTTATRPRNPTVIAPTTTTVRPTTTTIRATTTTVRPTTTTVRPTTTTVPPTTTTTTTTTAAPTTTIPTVPCPIVPGGTHFPLTDLTGCDFSGQTLANFNLFDADLQGVDFSGATIINTNLNEADLRGANLTGATFEMGSAIDANFVGADLTGASFLLYDFSRSDLRNTDFTNVVLENVSFSGPLGVPNASPVRLDDLDLSSVTLNGVTFIDAELPGVNFSGNNLNTVRFNQSNIAGMNISNTTNTDTIYHETAGTPTGHATASYLRTICPDTTPSNQSCW